MEFTYEREDRKTVLEKYEWDNVWIENTDDRESKRVLYIGDSISCGARRIATMMSDNKVLFDGFGTSKAVDNPFLKDSVKLFASQLPKTDVVLFNNGHHGFHLDEVEYAKHYEEVVEFLLKEYSAPLYLLLTTYVRNESRLERTRIRNNAVLKIAEKHNVGVIDLFSVTDENKDLLSDDGIHFTKEGYEAIAKEILSVVGR